MVSIQQLPKLALGTWAIRDRKSMVETIRKAVELGINHIDTAEMYLSAEETIAQALEGLDREKVFITSKVMPSNASYEGTLEACEGSLRRLGTDYLDLYLLHWWDGSYSLEETFRAFDKLLEQGKVRYVGVSNFDRHLLEQAWGMYPKIANDQVKYNLDNHREVIHELLPFASQRNILITGYSPFWQGRIPYDSRWKTIKDLSSKYGATPFQIILRFLTLQGNVTVIFKTENPEHLLENVKALELELEDEDVALLRELF